MKKLKLSRTPLIDTQQCVKNIGGSRFELVIVAAQRARELAQKNRADKITDAPDCTVTALLEIQALNLGK